MFATFAAFDSIRFSFRFFLYNKPMLLKLNEMSRLTTYNSMFEIFIIK